MEEQAAREEHEGYLGDAQGPGTGFVILHPHRRPLQHIALGALHKTHGNLPSAFEGLSQLSLCACWQLSQQNTFGSLFPCHEHLNKSILHPACSLMTLSIPVISE